MTTELDPKQKLRLEEAARTIEELARETGESPVDLLRHMSDQENGIGEVPPDLRLASLRGLGSEIWQGEDAQDYVDRLRGEWQ